MNILHGALPTSNNTNYNFFRFITNDTILNLCDFLKVFFQKKKKKRN